MLMKKCIIPLAVMAICMPAAAQEPADSTAAEQLDEVVVEARMQRTSATVSTYIPTRRQKNASQTGPDLLGRMGLPQLGLVSGNNVTTLACGGAQWNSTTIRRTLASRARRTW